MKYLAARKVGWIWTRTGWKRVEASIGWNLASNMAGMKARSIGSSPAII